MGRPSRWWIVLISLAMLAYGGVACWQMIFTRQRLASDPDLFLLAALIGLVGLCALITEIKYQPEDRQPNFLWQAIECYAAAWSKLWRSKWLLWIYGTAIAAFICSTLVSVMIGHWMRGGGDRPIYSEPPILSLTQRLMESLWWSAPYWLRQILPRFLPNVVTTRWDIVPNLVVVGLAISIIPVVQRLRRESEQSRKTGFFSVCLALLILGCLFSSWRWVEQAVSSREQLQAQARTMTRVLNDRYRGTTTSGKGLPVRIQPPSGTFGGSRVNTAFGHGPGDVIVSGVADIALSAILWAILVGGVLASLVRSKNGEAISRATFVEDAVRRFEPMVALALVCAIPTMASWLTFLLVWRNGTFIFMPLILVRPALMFAPYAVVMGGANCWAAVRASLRMWRQNWWKAISLIAVGSFFYVLVNGPVQLLWISNRTPATNMLWSPAMSIVAVVSNAVILLAVWEFYQSSARDPEPVSAAE